MLTAKIKMDIGSHIPDREPKHPTLIAMRNPNIYTSSQGAVQARPAMVKLFTIISPRGGDGFVVCSNPRKHTNT